MIVLCWGTVVVVVVVIIASVRRGSRSNMAANKHRYQL